MRWSASIGAAIAYVRGNRRWVAIFAAMIVTLAVAGTVNRAIKIAAGRSRPSVEIDVGLERPQSQLEVQRVSIRPYRSFERVLCRALFRQLARRRLVSANPAAHRLLAAVRWRASSVRCRLRRNAWRGLRGVCYAVRATPADA